MAGSVITVPNGNGFGTISTGTSGTPAFITSITGPSKVAPITMSFVASTTEPPPTARTKSTPCSLMKATARSHVSRDGFGSMPPNCSTLRLPRAVTIRSIRPLRTAEPPPYVMSTFASFGTNASNSLKRSLPNTICVGL